MHKISGISLTFAGAILSAALLGACSDDNSAAALNTASVEPASSSEQTVPPALSSSVEAPLSSEMQAQPTSSAQTAPTDLSSSSDATLLPPNDTTCCKTEPPTDPTCVETPVATIPVDSIGLADIADVFKTVRCNEKAVFVIRHGERSDAETGKETPLTYWEGEPDSVKGQPTDGVRQAIAVGKKLASADEFTYTHTKYLRTEQTCFYINQGRGQATFPHDSSEIYSISWYKKDKERYSYYEAADTTHNIRTVISGWAYDSLYADAFYDIRERSEEIVKTHIAPDYASMNKFRVICSHDDFILPLSVFASNGTVNFRFHDPASRHWPYFLSGVAVIIDDKNQIRYVPFKGLGIGAE